MTEPLFLTPSFHARLWGGRRLATVLGYRDLPDGPIGECWGVSAHPAGPSVVRTGSHAGATLAQVWEEDPAFFGREPADASPFPLLVKFLDAADWLSLQVHPDDAQAARLEGEPWGKSECWYVVAAEPGAELVCGHNAADLPTLQAAIDAGTWDGLLVRHEVRPGDFFFVPSGTLHSIGPGVLVCEVQQSSDVTYRVHDFDRVDAHGLMRALHLEQAKQVSRAPFEPRTVRTAEAVVVVPGGRRRQLVRGAHFSVAELVADTGPTTPMALSGDPVEGEPWTTFSVVAGAGTLRHGRDTASLVAGDHVVLPAADGPSEVYGRLTLVLSTPSRSSGSGSDRAQALTPSML